jgi:RND superfamily putative drug exporter
MTIETSAGEEVAGGLLVRLTRFSYRRRWIMVFVIWLPLLLALNTISGFMGIDYHTDFTLPGSESQYVKDALIRTGDIEDAGYTAQIVFASTDFTDDATRQSIRTLMEPFFAEVDKLDGVKITSPYTEDGKDFSSYLGGTSFAQISYTPRSEAGTHALAEKIKHLGDTMVPQEARNIAAIPTGRT